MIADLRPYPKYKESGLPWLGQVPAHWETMRLKRILRPVDRRSSTGTETLLSLRRDHGVVVYADHFSRPPQGVTTVGFKLVRTGELVVNRMQANNGLLFHSRLNGLVSPDYSVFEARSPLLMDYLSDLIRSPYYRAHFRRESTGLGTGSAGFLRLYDDRFLNTIVATPPFDEQTAMVRFFVWADGRLARAIRAKRKVIALLNEQKKAIIHRAVTGGLDPSVPLKPCGVPWLGDIPLHWAVVALGRLCTARCDGPFGSGLKSMHYTASGVRVIRLQNIGNGEFRDRGAAFISETHYATLGDHGVAEGDLLVAGLGDEKMPAGRACIAPPFLGLAMVKADCFRFRLAAGRTVPAFLSKHLSATAAGATACLSTGATRLRINLSATASRSVALPPVEEQQDIINFINTASAPMHTAISRLEREIELLREYRSRLVADVVTGKLDVREAAARLPDEAPTSASDEEPDVDADGDLGVSDEEATAE